ncbi:MAG: hypothetical protein ACWA45_10535 [Flavobacteriales bacterium]
MKRKNCTQQRIKLSLTCSQILGLDINPKFENTIKTSIEDPRYHVVTNLLDSEV